jgi:iron complex transport system ATP-binding protein
MTNVSWRRQGIEILHDIDWNVKEGEHWAILGLNGAGKTSLLNMVNGYIWPTTGEVTVLGNLFGQTDIHNLRKSIGWVSSALGERINGRHPAQDIVISGKFAAVGLVFADATKADEETAYAYMKQLGVAHTFGQAYEKCSQGEKQKLLIARGLMAEPKLLILDEPTSGLDFVAREDLLETIEKLGEEQESPTIIFVTHHIEEVLPIFSHVLLLKDGTTFKKGDRKEVLTAEHLSTLYGRNIEVAWHDERAWLSLKSKTTI